jgi:transcriptional regulator with XRE-family HTH domain
MELRIKEVLKEQKITALSLADKIGIAQPSMSNIVNGKVAPSLDTLKKIADALEVPITELFEKPSSGNFTCPKCGTILRLNAEVAEK